MSDLDPLTRRMYEQGQDGLQIAEVIIACNIASLITVQNGRADDPASYPGYPAEAAPHVSARMIIAQLINAGWRPPDVESLAAPHTAESL
jgi:hypothetical protein